MRYKHPTEIPRSEKIRSLEWTGDRIPCATANVRGDTHPMAWAADGELYIGTGDPNWMIRDGVVYASIDWTNKQISDEEYKSMCGLCVEKITGNPIEFELSRVNDMPGYIGGGGYGPKPSGMISVDGVLYYAVQNLLGWKPPRFRKNSQHGSDATILRSDDYGKTWTPDLDPVLLEMEKEQYVRGNRKVTGFGWQTPPEARAEYKGWKPMFPGNLFGGPSFIQFGQDNREAVDDYVYAVSGDHWDNGSEMRLGRVSKDKILDRDAWEFAIPKADGGVEWVKELDVSEPVLTIEGHLSLPEMVYIPSIKKYLLVTWALHTDFDAKDGSELTLLEADNPWGPFKLVYYEWMWYKEEASPYCPRIPLKWFDNTNLIGWMLHSGNWQTQIPYYLPQVRPFKLIMK